MKLNSRLLRNKRGFTLLEVLIVIVILGVIAGLAVPVYVANVEKSRAQEAITQLDAIRGSMLRYFASTGTYATATILANAGVAAGTDIDVNPNNLTGGQNQLFNYTITAQGVGTFTVTATRIAGRPAGAAIAAGGGTVTINQAGTVTRTGAYA